MWLYVITALCVSVTLEGETVGPENGVLYIHGGGGFNAAEFVNLAMKGFEERATGRLYYNDSTGKAASCGLQARDSLSVGEYIKGSVRIGASDGAVYLVQEGGQYAGILWAD